MNLKLTIDLEDDEPRKAAVHRRGAVSASVMSEEEAQNYQKARTGGWGRACALRSGGR